MIVTKLEPWIDKYIYSSTLRRTDITVSKLDRPRIGKIQESGKLRNAVQSRAERWMTALFQGYYI